MIVTGDKHLSPATPHYEANERYFNWFSQFKDLIWIDLGDFFDTSHPSPREYEQFFHHLPTLPGGSRRIFLSGNHEFNGEKNTRSTDPLEKLGIEVIKVPTQMLIEGKKILFLPHISKPRVDGKVVSLREYVEVHLRAQYEEEEFDYIFHHLTDHTQSFAKKPGIDLTWLKGKRVGGHIHKQTAGYLGVPFPTRADEAGQIGTLLRIEAEEKMITVPRFLDYVRVQYGEEPILNPEGETLLEIMDAPSENDARVRYAGFNINRVFTRKHVKFEKSKEDASHKTLKELLGDFCEERKVSDEVKEILFAKV
jgi:hypothetical protein